MKFRSNYDKKLKKIGQINLLPETHRYIEGNRYREGRLQFRSNYRTYRKNDEF